VGQGEEMGMERRGNGQRVERRWVGRGEEMGE
jgi:hypothetical protein